ncbi:DUF982 domain-containing protein [Mesorhizobium sp. M1217]
MHNICTFRRIASVQRPDPFHHTACPSSSPSRLLDSGGNAPNVSRKIAHWFVPPVFVKTETGDRHGCNNARTALEQLKRWTRRGPRWHKAVTLCLSDLEGDPIDPQVVRKAFEAAAKEAKMYLSPE